MAKTKKAVSKKVRDLKDTIASVAMEAIAAGATTEGVLKAVKRAFKDAKTTPACVGWYRSEMRRRKMHVPPVVKAPAVAPPKKKGKGKPAAVAAMAAV